MNVIILAGGQGTRLRPVFQGPKCLVPVYNKPVLEWIVDKVLDINQLDHIVLALNYKHEQVLQWWQETYKRTPLYIMDPADCKGTSEVVLNCLRKTPKKDLTLVLNGDTIPVYDFSPLISHQKLTGAPQMVVVEGYVIAGAAMLTSDSERSLENWVNHPYPHPDLLDFWKWVYSDKDTLRYQPRLFYDVGTPDGLEEAKIAKGDMQ